MSRANRKSAAALAYDNQGDPKSAPRVVAKGYGAMADMIVSRAIESGVHVHRAPEMVSLLMQVDLDDRIPPQLYRAVAELLAWLHWIEVGPPPPPHAQPETHDAAGGSAGSAAGPAGAAPRRPGDAPPR